MTIKGIVVDNADNTPLPFASVGIKSKPLPTVTNQEGEFEFHIPERYSKDTLTISMLGYRTAERLVSTFDSVEQITFRLIQSEQILDDVVITDTLAAGEIMTLVLERMSVNHPDFPVSMSAFYRETQEVDGSYVSLLEAALTVYDENNVKKRRSPFRTKIKIDQLRRSFSYRHEFNEWWDNNNLMMHALSTNPVPYGYHDLKKGDYRRLNSILQNGKTVYVVTADNLGYWSVCFYIEAGTYAILRIEEKYDTRIDGEKKWEVDHKQLSIMAYPQKRDVVIDFREFRGRYHMSYLKFDGLLTYVTDNEKKTDFRVKQDIIVNEINTDDPVRVQRNEATRIHKTLKSYKYRFNADFWDTYNVIRETPLEEKLIKDLERKASLQSQFQSHSTINR